MSRLRIRRFPMQRIRSDNTLCPACKQRARLIRTEQITDEIRHKTYLCGNDDCQSEFIASVAFVRWVHKRTKK